MNKRLLMVVAIGAFSASSALQAQSITGYSAVTESWFCPPGTVPPPPPGRPQPAIAFPPGQGPVYCTQSNGLDPQAQVYSSTEEDYTAALYYDLHNTTAEYYEGSTTPIFVQQTAPTNGLTSIFGGYGYQGANSDGIYSESTFHSLDFFYISAAGEYYDPYGYSTVQNGEGDGSYGDGYWFYVGVALYLVRASIVLGQTNGVLNHFSPHSGNPSIPSARSYSVLMQTFIPGNNALAPYIPPPFCGTTNFQGFPIDYFQGDNRYAKPSLGSYRSFQQVALGLGGVVPPTVGVQDTGYTHLFAQDAIDGNGNITQAAMQDLVQGDCHYLIRLGKASTAGMTVPQATGSGGSSANTTLSGSTSNPLTPSGAIAWNAYVQINQTSPTTINVTGSLQHKCFPAYELSVGGTDVDYQPPSSSSFPAIFACLAGAFPNTEQINQTIVVNP